MNDFRKIQAALREQAFGEYPELRQTKKIVGFLMLLLVALRVLVSVTETLFCITHDLSVSNCIFNYVSLFIISLFALVVYNGGRALLYIFLIGGAYSVFSVLIQNGVSIFQNLLNGDLLYDGYIFVLLFSCLFQSIIAVFLLSYKPAKRYFEKVIEINNTASSEITRKK